MGITKTNLFTDNQNTIATLLKALAHPARVAIIEYLLTVNTCICGDIVDKIPLAQPTISQHLKELKNAGIIQGTIEGNTVCYCINKETMALLQEYFTQILSELKNIDKKCC